MLWKDSGVRVGAIMNRQQGTLVREAVMWITECMKRFEAWPQALRR